MREADTNTDIQALALHALVWTLEEPRRAERLIALTGLSPEDLRARIGDPVVLGACLAFLEGHEPDLIACAAAIGVTPERLVAVRRALEAA
ncbi:DUF3572 domain-containing protein [uncultured Sphingomonas sp.]|uniref:DUF3572 domain-containing protein n=1 Tax=uncultured Sphingomonas sp. TaxID=158754 RepID=UPI00262D5B06|nr:DUF3572 domain-containing protein [uncultured Sphingomonas sp.]